MHFRFNITVSEKDYLDFNSFTITKSPYGKRQSMIYRIFLAVIALVAWYIKGITNIYSIVLILLPMLLVIIFWNKIVILVTGCHFKSLKKRGKTMYSKESVMEFYDEHFMEYTDENKSEYKYHGAERVSIVEGKVIYIHLNAVSGFILPVSCFESEKQFCDFAEFIRTKISNVDVHK